MLTTFLRFSQGFMRKNVLSLLAVVLTLPIAAQAKPGDGAKENVAKAIAFLIEEVDASHLTFTRNGKTHSSEEAANHIRRKYEHFKSPDKNRRGFYPTLRLKESCFRGALPSGHSLKGG